MGIPPGNQVNFWKSRVQTYSYMYEYVSTAREPHTPTETCSPPNLLANDLSNDPHRLLLCSPTTSSRTI